MPLRIPTYKPASLFHAYWSVFINAVGRASKSVEQ